MLEKNIVASVIGDSIYVSTCIGCMQVVAGAPWRVAIKLECAMSDVLQLAVHLQHGAELAARDAATVAQDAALQTQRHSRQLLLSEI